MVLNNQEQGKLRNNYRSEVAFNKDVVRLRRNGIDISYEWLHSRISWEFTITNRTTNETLKIKKLYHVLIDGVERAVVVADALLEGTLTAKYKQKYLR